MTEYGYTEEPAPRVGHGEHPPPTPQPGSEASNGEATADPLPLQPSTTETAQHAHLRLHRDNSSQSFNDANGHTSKTALHAKSDRCQSTRRDILSSSKPIQQGRQAQSQDHRQTQSQDHRQTQSQDHRQTQSQDHRQEQSQDHRQAQSQDHRQAQSQDHRQVQSQDHRQAQLLDYQQMSRDSDHKTNQLLLDTCREKDQKLQDLSRKLERQSKDYSRQLDTAINKNQKMAIEIDRLRHNNSQLVQQNEELKVKYNKKAARYSELDKDYRDLIRNIQVTDDDHSTIYQRLTNIRTAIENLIQKARRSASMNREHAIEHFRNSKRVDEFHVLEADLERYNLDLYMESAIMYILINSFFLGPLGCIFDRVQEFVTLSDWVDQKDKKVAGRWRQQLCVLVDQDEAAKERKENAILRVAGEITKLVYDVYTKVDMGSKIFVLCRDAFDLSFAMYGMEHKIYPFETPFDTPFDDETMTTPQSSNPDGKVSLLIFPAFKDDIDLFKIPPKVWCL
ncbi:hypothetical protein BGX21_010414 [Mortierella sp. AD011]|nr:hypothetical protein BGX21_010414 [Mortierella sp. AD011]